VNADGSITDVSGFGQDFNEDFFGSNGIEKLSAWLSSEGKSAPTVPADTKLAPATCRPSKIVCIGLNFKDHAEEGGMDVPAEPVVFFKSTSSIVGPNDDLHLPKGAEKTDWEVELAVVIGEKASYVSEADALNHVAGYVLHNDYSERSYQLERSGQWCKGKGCDTFAPLGPYVATPDEMGDIDQLGMWLKLNGETVQDGTTANLIFKVPFLISYLSSFMTLLPGDIISTGTPAGVGLGMKPPRYLKAGDVVELGIDGLGSSKQTVVNPWA
jgi:2-keto-4-pentenoate hydratase/2-oxohepta-3-ene-1,7-dioic acid hydratase in catechol pathway